jgi:hypothetical protein
MLWPGRSVWKRVSMMSRARMRMFFLSDCDAGSRPHEENGSRRAVNKEPANAFESVYVFSAGRASVFQGPGRPSAPGLYSEKTLGIRGHSM